MPRCTSSLLGSTWKKAADNWQMTIMGAICSMTITCSHRVLMGSWMSSIAQARKGLLRHWDVLYWRVRVRPLLKGKSKIDVGASKVLHKKIRTFGCCSEIVLLMLTVCGCAWVVSGLVQQFGLDSNKRKRLVNLLRSVLHVLLFNVHLC